MNAVGYLDSKSSSEVSDKENLVERISVVSEKVGDLLASGGLAVVIGWIGLLKFTPAEASAIEPFARHSPLSGWAFNYLDEVLQFW